MLGNGRPSPSCFLSVERDELRAESSGLWSRGLGARKSTSTGVSWRGDRGLPNATSVRSQQTSPPAFPVTPQSLQRPGPAPPSAAVIPASLGGRSRRSGFGFPGLHPGEGVLPRAGSGAEKQLPGLQGSGQLMRISSTPVPKAPPGTLTQARRGAEDTRE